MEKLTTSVHLIRTGKKNKQIMSDVKSVKDLVFKYDTLKTEIGKVIIGQHEAINFTLLSILCGVFNYFGNFNFKVFCNYY